MPEKQTRHFEIIVDPNTKTLAVDSMQLATRSDGTNCIRLCIALPEGVYEQGRFMVSTENLKNFAKMICERLDYYPQQEKREES